MRLAATRRFHARMARQLARMFPYCHGDDNKHNSSPARGRLARNGLKGIRYLWPRRRKVSDLS